MDAQNRVDEPLANANVIVMTDGQDTLSIDRLRELRNLVHRDTKVQLMFIAINGTNPDLQKFANESAAAGIDAGFYREFTPEQIRDVIGESKKIPDPDKDHSFFTQKSASALPPNIEAKLWELDRASREYLAELYKNSFPKPIESWRETAHKIPIPPVGFEPKRYLKDWLEHLRGLTGQTPAFHLDEFRKPIVDDFMNNFEKITGINMNSLSGKELAEIKHWLDEI